jgi:hypothetical protein
VIPLINAGLHFCKHVIMTPYKNDSYISGVAKGHKMRLDWSQILPFGHKHVEKRENIPYKSGIYSAIPFWYWSWGCHDYCHAVQDGFDVLFRVVSACWRSPLTLQIALNEHIPKRDVWGCVYTLRERCLEQQRQHRAHYEQQDHTGVDNQGGCEIGRRIIPIHGVLLSGKNPYRARFCM